MSLAKRNGTGEYPMAMQASAISAQTAHLHKGCPTKPAKHWCFCYSVREIECQKCRRARREARGVRA